MSSPNRATTLIGSFRCAIEGALYVFRTQRNARIHAAMVVVVSVLAAALQCSRIEVAVLVLTMGMVLVAEIANTVAETIVDLASPDYHKLAGIAKDVAAGGVLVAALCSVVVGLIILGPPLLTAFGL